MNRNDKLIVISFLFLNLYHWISTVEFKYGIPKIVKYLLAIFVLGVLIYNRIVNPSKNPYGKLFYAVIIVFVLWSIYLSITAVFQFRSAFDIQRLFAQRYFYLPYLIPIFILYTKFDTEFFSYYFHSSFKLIIFALIIQFYILLFFLSRENWYEQYHRIGIFDIGSNFLLLTAHISRKKSISNIILLYFVMNIMIVSYYGRRGLLIENFLLMFFMIYFRLRSNILKASDRKYIYFYVFVFIILIFFSFGYLFKSVYVFQRGFNRDALETSRSLVIEDFLTDFVSRKDWILGRGLDGKILRTIAVDGIESQIENGFLTVILKGGLIYLVLMLIIYLRACFLGFFKSRNDVAKALAVIILIQIIMMFSFGLPDYSVRYILVWISVSACFSPDIRNASNEEISQLINSSNIKLLKY